VRYKDGSGRSQVRRAQVVPGQTAEVELTPWTWLQALDAKKGRMRLGVQDAEHCGRYIRLGGGCGSDLGIHGDDLVI
jgi:hypothetical protein